MFPRACDNGRSPSRVIGMASQLVSWLYIGGSSAWAIAWMFSFTWGCSSPFCVYPLPLFDLSMFPTTA